MMSRYLLLVPMLLTLTTACMATGPDRGSFGPFDRSLSTTSHGYQVVADPTGSAPAAQVERFEVRPGDCAADTGWSDCANDRERSELSEKGGRNPAGSEAWYGWSFFLPADWVNIYPTKTALGQFHQQGSHPVWMFQNDKGGLWLDDQVDGRTSRYIPLIADEDLRGRWHRIELHARWSRGEDGFLRIWVDGVEKLDHSGPTMSAELVYFKYGVYRSFMTRYRQAKGIQDVPAQTAFYANVRRSSSREGLVPSR